MGKSNKGGPHKKTNHRKGGPKYVANADEIEARNRREHTVRGSAEGDVDDVDDVDGLTFDRAAMLQAAEESDEEGRQPKPKGPAGVIATANPNDVKPRNIKIKDLGKLAAAEEGSAGGNPEERLTRRQREELEAQRKKEAYQRLHAQGKTDEYKKDMERLQEARKRREEAEQKSKDNENARAAEEKAARKAAADVDEDEDDVEKLDPREIKKMNPKQLKDQLKSRGLSTQGQKKDLMARLLAAN